MRKNSKLCSLRFDLHEEEFAVKEIDNQVEISKVLVCNGLLLCVNVKSNDIQSLMVWNPYLGQTRWIHQQEQHLTTEFEIYDFKSDSWRTLDLDVTPDWGFEYVPYSTSLKGNTYFVDYDRFDETTNNYFICFDFTRERFGEYLQLPWSRDNTHSFFIDEDTKRAVLFSVDWHDSLKTEEEYYNAAYIIGENDFFKSVDLGATNPLNDYVPAVCPN
ncbi:hypothetical protein F2Q70_00025493, partial [Brassica cretica]